MPSVVTNVDGNIIEESVSVLLVSTSTVSLPTSVSVDEGNVSVPPLSMVDMTGSTIILFVSTWMPSNVTPVAADTCGAARGGRDGWYSILVFFLYLYQII